MRLTEIWSWWSQFPPQKNTICLQNAVQLSFSYWTENMCILDQHYLHDDLCFLWGIWWPSLQTVSSQGCLLLFNTDKAYSFHWNADISWKGSQKMRQAQWQHECLCAILQIEASDICLCFMLDEDLLFPIMPTMENMMHKRIRYETVVILLESG